MYPWPLPEGHAYGPGVKHHHGSDVLERIALTALQRRMREHWRSNIHPTGRYDGQTQKALAAFQLSIGEDPTGILDEYLWRILWA